MAERKSACIIAVIKEIWERGQSFDISFLKKLSLDDANLWLRSLPGIGPKTAACVLLFSFGRPALPVDTHVHRISNRLGWVKTQKPTDTQAELEDWLPKWKESLGL